MKNPGLYIHPEFSSPIATAQTGIFLIGGWVGWPNFGDYLQLKSTIELYHKISCRDLFVLLDAQSPAARGETNAVLEAIKAAATPIYYHFGSELPASEHLEGAAKVLHPPSTMLIHIYGGGFINDAWGRPLRAVVEKLIELHEHESEGGQRKIVMSGLQVSPSEEAKKWRPLFMQAEYIGTRDMGSLAYVRRLLGSDSRGQIEYSGDDALPALANALKTSKGPNNSIAVHVNCADYSTPQIEKRLSRIAEVLATVAQHFESSRICDLLVAYPNSHVREEEAARALESLYTSRVTNDQAPMVTFRVRNILEEVLCHELCFAHSFLVTCSYHVALTGLLSNTPTLLMVDNDYYRQKARGLRDAFPMSQFIALEDEDDVTAAVKSLIAPSDCSVRNTGSYMMWAAQFDKTLRLTRICQDLERAVLSERLDATAAAFREVAQDLGELRKRLILEERLAHLNQPPPKTKHWSRIFHKSYWRRRREKILRNIKKRLDRIT